MTKEELLKKIDHIAMTEEIYFYTDEEYADTPIDDVKVEHATAYLGDGRKIPDHVAEGIPDEDVDEMLKEEHSFEKVNHLKCWIVELEA